MTPLVRTRNRLAALVATAALGLGGAALVASAASASTSWTDHDGNDNGALTCSGSLTKIDSNESATVDGVRFTSDGTYLSFQSLQDGKAVTMVSVKGGDAYRVYTYSPPATSGSGLRSPTNNGGNVPEISHYTVCITDVPTTIPPTTAPETTVPETTVPETTPPTTAPSRTDFNLTSMCRPDEDLATFRIRNATTTTYPYTLSLYGSSVVKTGAAQPGDTFVDVAWSSSSDTWILEIGGQRYTKAVGDNPLCVTPPPTTQPPTTVPETTLPPTTVPETTLPPTTVPETTVPETTVPETTVPETTEPPASTVVSPPEETTAGTTAAPTTEAPPATVVQDPSAPTTVQDLTLPVTGSSSSLLLALVAAGLIAGGGALLVITRKRASDEV